MTYCLGIVTKHGLVMASDSRTNSGTDQVSVCRKMFWFEKPGERVFIVLTSGGLSLSQSVLTLLDADFQKGEGLAEVTSMYEAARVIGDQVRKVRDVVQEGQAVEVEVLRVDHESRKIALSLKAVARSKEDADEAAEDAERLAELKTAEEMMANRPVNPNLRGGIGGNPVRFDTTE